MIRNSNVRSGGMDAKKRLKISENLSGRRLAPVVAMSCLLPQGEVNRIVLLNKRGVL